ncbi:MAG: sugar phosphate isomerase/epimerase [Actinomycetota bacterium]|nr:sugar phosphate isomerase/epimerase [Actinomycetota bacterium]
MSPLVLLSTGAMTRDPLQTDHQEIVRHGPGLGLSGFELGVYAAWYGHLDDVVSDLRESGLAFPVVHGEKGIGAGLGSADSEEVETALERLELNCRAAAALGAKTLVLHLWEKPDSDRELERNLGHLPTCLDTAAAYGVTLAIETIPGDAGTPLANIRLALERDSRCRVALDTEFLGFHGQLGESVTADWLWEEKFVHHVHLKDFDGRLREGNLRRYLLPGEGTLDLQGFLTGLVQREYSGALTLEATAVDEEGRLDPERLTKMAAVVIQLAT